MADGKWISSLKASTPLSEAARKVLGLRLGAVRDRLRPALTKTDEDVEHVHQLRVATRRARAALDIFRDCLPGKAYRKARRTLRHIRRGAGEARDWDVFLAEIQDHLKGATPARRPGLIFLAGYGSARRQDAQNLLREQTEDIDLLKIAKDTAGETRDSESSLGELAQAQLAKLLHELTAAAEGNLDKYERLHEVRIIGKRLRYAMEVFAGCYAEPFRAKFYALVEEMQEILGQANDSFVAVQRLRTIGEQMRRSQPALWKEAKRGIEHVTRFHERRLPVQRKKFERWWARWRKLNVEKVFEELLGGHSKRARTPTAAAPAAEPRRPEEAFPAEVVPFPGTVPAPEPRPEAPPAESPAPSKPAVG